LGDNGHGPKIGEALPLFGEGNWVPSNNNNKPICNAPDASVTDPEARWPGPRATSVSGDILIHPAVGSQRTEAESWGLCVFLGGAVFPSNIMWPGPRPTSVPSGIWMGPAVWPQCAWAENSGASFWQGGLGPYVTQCGLGRCLPRMKWHLDACNRLATIHGPKMVVLCPPFFWGGAGSSSNTKSPGLMTTSILRGILIHPAVGPQRIWAKLGLCPF